MNADLLKKVILLVAAIALVGIWARNLFLFVPSVSAIAPEALHLSAPSSGQAAVNANVRPDTGVFVYTSTDRDPFAIPREPQPVSTTRAQTPKVVVPPEPPHASLQGIVWNNKSPHVVVFDSLTRQSVILRRGDSINSYLVLSVDQKRVVLRSKHQRVVWEAGD